MRIIINLEYRENIYFNDDNCDRDDYSLIEEEDIV